VTDSALFIASAKLDMMLSELPAARQNLIMHGVELHIIGKDQQRCTVRSVSDLKCQNQNL
jgi:hypothetical protein